MDKGQGNRSAEYEDKSSYYYVNGKRVGLLREPRVYAVRYSAGRTSRDVAFSPRADRFLRETSENIGFISNYNLQLYRTNPSAVGKSEDPGGGVRDVIDEVTHLSKEAPVEYAAVAYRRHAGASPERVDDLMFATRQFLVRFKPEVSRGRIDALNANYGVLIVESLGYTENGFLLAAPQADGERGPVALSNVYFESGLAIFAHPDFVRRRHLRGTGVSVGAGAVAPRTEFLPQQWHLQTAKAVDAWALTRGSSSVKIAILDDGVDTGHGEFAGKVVAQRDFASGTADGNPKKTSDVHGTACAGVAVALGNHASGAAPLCSLMAVRYPGFLGAAEEANMFRWSADQGADVISCSWGPPDRTGAVDPLPDNVRAAVHYCVSTGRDGKGIAVLWAAGNGNESVSNDGYAANPEVMAIAASTDRELRAPYSDFGPEIFICAPSSGSSSVGEKRIFTVDRRGNAGYNPDSQTGVSHPANHDYTDDFGGTSSSTPLVAGVVGLMLSANPDLTVGQVRQILRETSDKIDTSGGNYDSNGHSQWYGYGRVNAHAAVQRAQGSGGSVMPGQPSISAPASVARSGSPPVFRIDKGGRALYAVEVAARANLFDDPAHGSERTDHNFYGSWVDELASATPYALPNGVWNRLKQASQLFYRLHVADDDAWSNWVVTVPDNQAAGAPSLQITGGGSAPSSPATGTTPSISTSASIARTAGPPVFQVEKGGRQLYAVEVATRAELFNDDAHGSERTEDNFYGSWEGALLSVTPYTLPTAVWNRLKPASQLFYRLHAADDDAWSNWAVTVSDDAAAGAPRIQITGGGGPSSGGSGTAGSAGTVTYPSGATFSVVDTPQDGVDYSDHVGNGVVPLIEVRGRGEEKLSDNFQVKELEATDGARYARISPELVSGLQRIRDRVGAVVKVRSSYRHPRLNGSVGGVDNSQHIAGRAADIRTAGKTPLELARIALEEMGCDIGIGLGKNTIHVDVRGTRASWRYKGAELSETEFDQFVTTTCRQLGRSVGDRTEYEERLGPAVAGPERWFAGGDPPEFHVEPGRNPFYAVEVATDPQLLCHDHESERTDGNFFGSWATEGLREAGKATTYSLPLPVWEKFRNARRLYYRIVTSSTPSPTWTNVRCSTEDGDAPDAPWITLYGGAQDKTEGSLIAPLDSRSAPLSDEAKWRI